MSLSIKRVYDGAGTRDGYRILVDRIWPRGVKREDAAVDLWLKEIAPSTELRKWFGHDPERWVEFRRRYRAELARNPEPLEQVRELVSKRKVTLVFSAKGPYHQARVLQELLAGDA